jgi:hypothetical protein
MNKSLSLVQWIIPIAIILAGWFVGIIFERIFFTKLKQFVGKTQFQEMN